MLLRLDDNDGSPGFTGNDGSRQPGRARSDDDDVGGVIPSGILILTFARHCGAFLCELQNQKGH
jgi:hypothetical protein